MANQEQSFYSDPDYLAEGFLISNYVWNCGETEDPNQWPGLEGDYTLRNWRDEFYRWDGACYIKVSDAEMKLWVKRHLHSLNEMAMYSGGDNDQHIRITGQLISNILLCIAGTEGVHIPASRELNTWADGRERLGIQTFAFNNSLAMIDTKSEDAVLTKHTPRYFSLTKLPYDYDVGADCPRWRGFLDEVVTGDSERIRLLQRWAGYLLTASNRQQKFLLIAGDGQNGKTVFTTILEKMVGADNVRHVPLSQFSNQFSLASTLGKVLNSTSESSHGLDEFAETTLKSYTSGDRMTFQRKYKDPIHAYPTAKVMISTNQLPQFADKSSGIWRRMLFVPFEVSFPEEKQNRNLIVELARELPGIFNWALDGMGMLAAEGRFIMPHRCKTAIGQYRRDVNPARMFLQDNYTESLEFDGPRLAGTHGIPCGEVYRCYVQFCGDNGYKPLNNTNFGKEVKRTLPTVKKEHRRDGALRITVYCGLTVKEGSEVATQTIQDIQGCQRWQY